MAISESRPDKIAKKFFERRSFTEHFENEVEGVGREKMHLAGQCWMGIDNLLNIYSIATQQDLFLRARLNPKIFYLLRKTPETCRKKL